MDENNDAAKTDDAFVPSARAVAIFVYLALLTFAAVLGFDNWRTGMSWDADGPQAGYFPFYLCLVLAAACLFGLYGKFFGEAAPRESFVAAEQFRRVMQVFVPTFLYCLAMQWLGLYVASFLLVAGFMWRVGGIAAWKSLLTAFVFSLAMFVTFDIAFDVIMPKGPLEAAFGY